MNKLSNYENWLIKIEINLKKIFPCRVDSVPEGQKPALTMYTREPCPLCDELKAELESYLPRVNFETVDISKKENLRYLRLYRYEIPVLFLNGYYLCKHRLDRRLLEDRLNKIEENNWRPHGNNYLCYYCLYYFDTYTYPERS